MDSSSSSSSSSPSSMAALDGTWLLLRSFSFLFFLLLFFRRDSEGSLDRGRWVWREEWRWSTETERTRQLHQLLTRARKNEQRGGAHSGCPPRGRCGAAHRARRPQDAGSAGSDGRPKPCSGHCHLPLLGVTSCVAMRGAGPLTAKMAQKCKKTNQRKTMFLKLAGNLK